MLFLWLFPALVLIILKDQVLHFIHRSQTLSLNVQIYIFLKSFHLMKCIVLSMSAAYGTSFLCYLQISKTLATQMPRLSWFSLKYLFERYITVKLLITSCTTSLLHFLFQSTLSFTGVTMYGPPFMPISTES